MNTFIFFRFLMKTITLNIYLFDKFISKIGYINYKVLNYKLKSKRVIK